MRCLGMDPQTDGVTYLFNGTGALPERIAVRLILSEEEGQSVPIELFIVEWPTKAPGGWCIPAPGFFRRRAKEAHARAFCARLQANRMTASSRRAAAATGQTVAAMPDVHARSGSSRAMKGWKKRSS